MKYFLVLAYCSFALTISAQTPQAAGKDSVRTATVLPDIEEELMESNGTPNRDDDMEKEPSQPLFGRGRGAIQISKLNDSISFLSRMDESGWNVYGVQKYGKQILPILFRNNYALITDNYVPINKGLIRRMGTIDRVGIFDLASEQWVVPLEYSSVEYLDSARYIVRKGKIYGIYNTVTHSEEAMGWSSMNLVEDKAIIVEKNQKFGIINGNTLTLSTPCVYTKIQSIKRKKRFLVENNGLYNIIDVQNKPVFSHWYQSISIPVLSVEKYVVKRGNKMGIIDENEKVLLPVQYQNITRFPYDNNFYLVVNKKGKYGFVYLDGSIMLPCEYDLILREGEYWKGTLLVQNKEKYGIIRLDGKKTDVIIPVEYDTLFSVKPGYIVKKDGKYGIIDKSSKSIMCPVEFDQIEAWEKVETETQNYIATKNSTQFLINSKGEALNERRYDKIRPVHRLFNNFGDVFVPPNYLAYYKEGKVGIMDASANELSPAIFEEITGLAAQPNLIVKSGGKFGIYHLHKSVMVLEAEFDQIFASQRVLYGQMGNDFYTIILSNLGLVDKSKL